jgi:aspartyl-tRNA(Asn)/glutamyl-tRNA(Gln) amidotransferase subunit C
MSLDTVKSERAIDASLSMDDLRITAQLAHLNIAEAELEAAFPAFTQMLEFFQAMRSADTAAVETAASGHARGEFGADKFRKDAQAARNADAPGGDLGETLVGNSGERDGRFIVVPNVL